MRALVFICLVSASCAHQTHTEQQTAADSIQTPTSNTLKPALQVQLVPGITYGNVALQEMTIETARHAFVAKSELSHCLPAQTEVLDTWPMGEPTPSEYSNAFLYWKELWEFDVCGSNIDAEIIYMLHRKSGLIDVKVSPLRKGQILELS